MALEKIEAARRAGEAFQLSRRVVGWRRKAADENQIRRHPGGRAVQRPRHVAAQSAGALDDKAQRHSRIERRAKEFACECRDRIETRRPPGLFRLHVDRRRNNWRRRSDSAAVSGFEAIEIFQTNESEKRT